MTDTPTQTNGKYKNRCELTVRLGREPEARYLPTGTLFVTTRAALNTGRDKAPLWLTLKAFASEGDESLPNALNALAKGQAVTVIGRLDYREYARKDGTQGSDMGLVLYELKAADGQRAALEQRDLFTDDYVEESMGDDFPF